MRTVADAMRPAADESLDAEDALAVADAHAHGVRLYPDQSIDTALRLVHGRRVVPVVHRADATRVVGAFVVDDVIKSVAHGATGRGEGP